ncbi:MAG: hypothetical protein ACN4GR_04780 [Arenicellales bacterium]
MEKMSSIFEVSKKRVFLSWYIDFLFFITLWELMSYFLGLNNSLPFWVPYIFFITIRAMTGKYLGSVGHLFLSINRESNSVNPDIYDHENWLTVLLGVLFILEGTKQLVRWTDVWVPQPFFGFIPGDLVQIVIHLFLGMTSILAGYWFLKLNIKGLYLGISVAFIGLVSDILSWNLWDPVVKQMVIARKEVQGRPVKEGEIEMMQALLPEGIVALTILVIIRHAS